MLASANHLAKNGEAFDRWAFLGPCDVKLRLQDKCIQMWQQVLAAGPVSANHFVEKGRASVEGMMYF